ncbi:hypothetical protein HAX54_022803 [Datura stramonium]|uniref:MATH domain-containing protein n=1 Tax=Datura stramonium TaxID=4076 RepID=A0ABS8UV52_DATST|nr:hypothetical protein [Datura stramonium]
MAVQSGWECPEGAVRGSYLNVKALKAHLQNLDAITDKTEEEVVQLRVRLHLPWKLCLYPNGDEERGGKGHISLYLAITDTDGLPLGWEVNVSFKFLIFDQTRDKYLTIQGPVTDVSEGFLVDDSLVVSFEISRMFAVKRFA